MKMFNYPQYILLFSFLPLLLIGMEEKSLALPPKAKTTIRVMTYNLRRAGPEKKKEQLWQNRLPLIVKVLEQINPDIAGFQEAAINQIEDLEKKLPHLKPFGEGRGESWLGFGLNEYNPIYFDPTKVELIENETFSINDSKGYGWMPWHASETGWLPRICTWGKFHDKRSNKQFYVYNTHLDNKYPTARINNAKKIQEVMSKKIQQEPIILMGDFNTEFIGEIKEVFANFSLAREKVAQPFGPEETRTGWDDQELKIIDYILINKSEDIQAVPNYAVVDKEGKFYPSDHRPVFADIEFANS